MKRKRSTIGGMKVAHSEVHSHGGLENIFGRTLLHGPQVLNIGSICMAHHMARHLIHSPSEGFWDPCQLEWFYWDLNSASTCRGRGGGASKTVTVITEAGG